MLAQVICVLVMSLVGLLTGLFLAFLTRDSNQRRARLFLVATAIGLGLLVLGTVVASFLHSSPENAALTGYEKSLGKSFAELEPAGGGGNWDPFGGHKFLVFKIKGSQPPQFLHIELFQPAYFLPWEIMDVYVETPERPGK